MSALRIRTASAASLLALALIPAAAAACSHRPSSPTAGPTPQPSPTLTAPTPTTGTPTPGTTAPAVTPTTTRPAPTSTVISSRVALPWLWTPEERSVEHAYRVPPVPQLIRIGAAHHPAQAGEHAYDRVSFTFTTAFPGYRVGYARELVRDGSGQPIPLDGLEWFRITFGKAQAHTDSGHSSIVSQPPAHLGFPRIASYAAAGDFEGVVTYGLGLTWPIPHSNPQFAMRVYEVHTLTAQGRHEYTVAIDVDAS